MNRSSREYLKPTWCAPSNVHAVSTTRKDGYSAPPFDFNLATHVDDHLPDVELNRSALITDLQLPSSPIYLNQVHGESVLCVENHSNHASKKPVTADAVYSNQPNQVLAILTADCLPIFLTNQSGTEIAIIHAGWRGLNNALIKNTLDCFRDSANHLIAYLGPAICVDCYDVGEACYEQCVSFNANFQTGFKKIHGRWHLDLYTMAKVVLASLGVSTVYGSDCCTFCDTRFFSHRRNQGKTGRQAHLIWMNHT